MAGLCFQGSITATPSATKPPELWRASQLCGGVSKDCAHKHVNTVISQAFKTPAVPELEQRSQKSLGRDQRHSWGGLCWQSWLNGVWFGTYLLWKIPNTSPASKFTLKPCWWPWLISSLQHHFSEAQRWVWFLTFLPIINSYLQWLEMVNWCVSPSNYKFKNFLHCFKNGKMFLFFSLPIITFVTYIIETIDKIGAETRIQESIVPMLNYFKWITVLWYAWKYPCP